MKVFMRGTLCIVGLITGVICSVGVAKADSSVPFAWKATHTNGKWEAMTGEKETGKAALFFTNQTSDKQTSGGNLIDGNQRVNSGFWEFSKGRGIGHGFARAEKAGDIYVLEWTGVCYDLSGADGKPISRCGGGFVFVPGAGTGRFANVKGGGIWRGMVQPNGDFEEEANGYIEQ